MPTAAAFIEALQRRLRLAQRRDAPPPGEFPPGWQHWLDSLHQRQGAVTGATADALMAVFDQRPLAAPPARAQTLGRWRAFASLWRQHWQPPEREERGLRWAAGAASLFWHVFFGGLLVWLMYLQYFATRPPPREDSATLVEYIGRGTPQQPGGGADAPTQAPAQPAPSPQPSQAQPQPSEPAQAQAAAPAAPAVPAPAAPDLQANLPEVRPREVPEPSPPPAQPVVVSEPAPDAPQVFVLPPTRRQLEDATRAPQIQAAPAQVATVEVPAPVQAPARALPQREIALPTVAAQPREVTVREVPAPLPSVPLRELPPRTAPAPQLQPKLPQVRVAEIPTPQAPAPAAPAPAASTPTATAATPAARPSPSAPAASAPAPAAAPRGDRASPPAAATAGAGPRPAPAPGNWPSPRRADDWGESARNRPGAQQPGQGPGLYNRDGSVRIADAPGSASPGMPPGTITEEIKNLDRAGTWLRRKPTDYEPTELDKYWRPNETLLAEWVRRSVQTVMIPIPGTSKRIKCSVVLLMAGGGCGISDPNLNDQPAEARPPPEVPFKPHLQEDNGSVRPPPGG